MHRVYLIKKIGTESAYGSIYLSNIKNTLGGNTIVCKVMENTKDNRKEKLKYSLSELLNIEVDEEIIENIKYDLTWDWKLKVKMIVQDYEIYNQLTEEILSDDQRQKIRDVWYSRKLETEEKEDLIETILNENPFL